MVPPLSKSHLPWPVRVGQRVAIRYRLDASADANSAALTDVTGELVRADAHAAAVAARHGEVTVPWSDVVAAKEIPPRATRPGPPHRTIDRDDLQRLMVDGMPALQTSTIGQWPMRWAEGYTGRANSVLVVGDPGRPVPVAVDEAVAFYTAHQLPTRFQVPGPSGFDPTHHRLVAEALNRGGSIDQRTLVMTAATAAIALAHGAGIEVRSDSAPGADWWRTTSGRAIANRAVLERIIAEVHDGAYPVAYRDGPVASARVACSPGWMGIFDLHVPSEHRGHGYARRLMGAAARRGYERGFRSVYLQVTADNEPAVALYESLGFTTHHEYWYATA